MLFQSLLLLKLISLNPKSAYIPFIYIKFDALSVCIAMNKFSVVGLLNL